MISAIKRLSNGIQYSQSAVKRFELLGTTHLKPVWLVAESGSAGIRALTLKP